MTWHFFESGAYNKVFHNSDRSLVLKELKSSVEIYDAPERSVRLWNSLNSVLGLKAAIHPRGWVCPYINGRQASDREMHLALIDIYNRCGRIVVDAATRGNMLKRDSDGEIVCVDVGMAVLFKKNVLGRARADSAVSDVLRGKFKSGCQEYFLGLEDSYPLTIATIKALTLIAEYRQDIDNLDFLKNHYLNLFEIAAYFNLDIDLAKVKHFQRLLPPNISALKSACVDELALYIGLRGQLDEVARFHPSMMTRFFRNSALTQHKVEAAQTLQRQIRQAHNIDEIRQSVLAMQANPDLLRSRSDGGLRHHLSNCLDLIAQAQLASFKTDDEIDKLCSFDPSRGVIPPVLRT